MLGPKRAGARIDELEVGKSTEVTVRSYDLDGLREFENRYETIYRYHVLLLTGEEGQLTIADRILKSISKNVGK